MTDVGKISLGVEIDADQLAAKLGEAVRRAIAPALASIQRELNQTQREYDQTGRSAQKSSATQAAGAREVAAQVAKIGNEQTKTAAKTVAAGQVTTRQLNAITRAYERQTAAIIANTSARAANAAAPVGGPPGTGGGSPGGGGGGPPGGRHAGGFMRGGQGRFGFLTSPVGLGGIALGAQALPAATTAVMNIVGAVQQLGQAGLALPGIFAGAASSIGVAVIGFKGMGDAIKALNEAADDPEKLEKATEALKNMAPAAVEVAKEISRLNTGALRDFQKSLAQTMFEGVGPEIGATADRVLPRIQPGMQKVAGAWNNTLKTALATLGSDNTLNLADQIFGNTADAQNRANKAIGPIVNAFGTLAKEGSYFLPRLADGLTKVSERFERFITRNSENGNMFRWIDEGLNGLRAFGNAVLNVGSTITGLTKALGAAQGSMSGDGGFLGWLERSTKAMTTFVNSAEGQRKIGAFFRDGKEDMAQWGALLKDLLPVLKSILDGFATWGEILLPIISTVASLVQGLNQVPGLLEAIVVGFLAWRSIGPIISGLTTKLNTMSAAASKAGGGGAAGAAGGGGKFGRAAAGVGLVGLGAVMQHTAGQEETGSQIIGGLTTIAGGALTGAAIGSVVPGVGTAIGAGVGTAIGTAIAGLNFLLAENKTATEQAAAAAEKHADALNRSRAAADLTAQATKTASDSLLGSKGAFDAASVGAVGDVISQIPDKLAGRLPEETVKGVADAMANLNMTTEQLSTTVTGSGPYFDAMIGQLNAMGEPGRILAEQLTGVRNEMLGIAENAATSAPLLETLANSGMGSVQQAAVNVSNALRNIPPNTPINMDMPQGPAVLDILTKIGVEARVNDRKQIEVAAPLAPAVLEQLRALGYEVTHNNDKTISVKMDQAAYLDTMAKMGNLRDLFTSMTSQAFNVPPPPVPNVGQPGTGPFFIPKPGGADGMVVPGYAPGLDVVNAVLAPGEGVLIPEAVRGLGGSAGVYAINSMFRSGLSRRHYADGGVHLGTGALPGPIGPETELSVLIQIRDLLGGKGGAASNPLAATAANTATTATAASKDTGTQMGPFGTPLKKRGNPAYEMAAAAISALGGDPEKWIGMDPSTYVPPGAASAAVGPGGVATGALDTSRYATALSAFASSGNLADLAGLGLDANDPVVKAIVAARNKKKGGLDDTAIGGLVNQVLAGGGYTGVLDSSNTSLISALQTFREKLAKGQGVALPTATAATGVIPAATPAGASSWLNKTGTPSDKGLVPAAAALNDLIMQNFPAITEIGGYRQDAHPDHPSGRALDIMIPGGDTSGGRNPQGKVLGDQIWQWLLSTGVIDPQGSLWQTSTGGNHWNHIHARIAEGMESAMPGMGLLPGMPGATTTGLPAGVGGAGTPVYVTNWPGQGGAGVPPGVDALLGGVTGGVGTAAQNVIGDVLGATSGALMTPDDKRMPDAELGKLIRERNPMAIAAALGFNVQDFTRQGGAGGDFMRNDQKFTADGRLLSDTAALSDRTTTDLHAQLQAMREQLVDVIEQVQNRLEEDALEPVVKAGVQSALESLKDSVSSAIGSAMGTAAAPPIADAVKSAVSSLPIDNSGAGGVGGNAANIATSFLPMAGGGAVRGGTPGKDSVPALLMPGEYVLDTGDVARMGGIGAIDVMRNRGLRRMATGGGVIGNDTVGAEFFGVSEIPIISTIVNLIIRVLLKVIGVEIEVRDTLNEMTGEFRQFRGDSFKAFDAQGRLMNDTSALIERTSSSEETAAAERIRILKIVIEAIIKYIIEKVIVPITKAVANAAIQAGASAAGTAINTQAPGAGGIVSSLISSAGQAGVEIAAEVGTDFALAMSSTLIDVIAEGLQGAFPDLVTGIFGGGALAGIFDPSGNVIQTLLGGLVGAFTTLLGGGLFGGLATMIPGDALFGGLLGGSIFDNGGMAEGVGFLPKATMDDELVLSPTETDIFSRFVSALERGGFGSGGNRTVHAPITVIGGGPETAEQVQDRLLKLIP